VSSKVDLLPIVAAHFATLRDAQSGKLLAGDFFLQLGVPFAAAAGGWLSARVDLSNQYGNLIAALAIVFGFAFAVTVFVFQLRMQMAEMQVSSVDQKLADIAPQIDMRAPGLVNELFSNCLYAVVLGGFATLATGFVGIANLGRVADSILVGIFAHLLLVLMMCFKRLNSAYAKVSSLAT
jgi:hypothetical protein